MDKINNMCATPDSICCWEDIDFKIAEKKVKKLQRRIKVAYGNKRYDVVKYLQHTLIHSFYAKALAVKIVSTNNGKNTPGVDGIIWNTSELKFNAIKDLKRRGYKTKSLRRIYIPKSDGRVRPLSIPTMKDRAMQTLYRLALEPIAELTADECSYGYRIKRSAKDAILCCCDYLSEDSSLEWVLKLDIKSCFDTISHEWLLSNIFMDKEILMKFLKCGYIDNSILYPTLEGVPQGGSISSILCNMTLDGLESMIVDTYRSQIHLIRYADDILVLGTGYSFLQSIVPVVEKFLSERNLEISRQKSEITHIKNGVTFLGWKIYKEEHQIISVPARKSIDSLLSKIITVLNNDILPKSELCKSLKQIIRGWLNYYNVAQQQSIYGVEFEVISCIYDITRDSALAEYISKIFEMYNNI